MTCEEYQEASHTNPLETPAQKLIEMREHILNCQPCCEKAEHILNKLSSEQMQQAISLAYKVGEREDVIEALEKDDNETMRGWREIK